MSLRLEITELFVCKSGYFGLPFNQLVGSMALLTVYNSSWCLTTKIMMGFSQLSYFLPFNEYYVYVWLHCFKVFRGHSWHKSPTKAIRAVI